MGAWGGAVTDTARLSGIDEPNELVGVMHVMVSEDWGTRRGVISRRDGGMVVIGERGAGLRPE
jgi:hypothetical protein